LLAAAVALPCAAASAAVGVGRVASFSSRAVAHDQGVVSAVMHRCRYFSLSGCFFGRAAVSGDGRGRRLYAIDLAQSAGSCGAGIVWFFDGERLIGRTGRLPPYAQASALGVKAAGPRRFKVYYLVNRSGRTDCAHWGNGGTDPYVYRWNGSRMVLVSGKPPRRPKMLAPGFKKMP
jgi:hypothetical protein